MDHADEEAPSEEGSASIFGVIDLLLLTATLAVAAWWSWKKFFPPAAAPSINYDVQ